MLFGECWPLTKGNDGDKRKKKEKVSSNFFFPERELVWGERKKEKKK